jgi:hypothetical protein
MQKNHAFTRIWQSPAIRGARHLASPRRWVRYLSADWRPLPRVIIAGAQKAGTTSLFGYLAGHPRCLRPLTKEINFFDQNYARGERWYRMHFPIAARATEQSAGESEGLFCIEASPHYMFEPQVASRVHQLLPDAKAIFLLRNPVNRAYSHHQHQVRRGQETRSFEQCIALEIEQRSRASRSPLEHQHPGCQPRLSYLARGVYVEQLQNWRDYFPFEQMLVIEAERMFKDPRLVLDEAIAFLGVESWAPAEFGNLNPGRYGTPMSASARESAAAFFAPHNERLFQFQGRRFDWR